MGCLKNNVDCGIGENKLKNVQQ